jgi:uracil-DNA glycosylase family 4
MKPKKNCGLCSRLVDLRNKNKILYPEFYNDRVLGIGSYSSKFLIVGLAPGLRGANRTGKIFNGDFSGNLLFGFLKKYHISKNMESRGISNLRCRITNAVKCFPLNNKPTLCEVKTCNVFLASEINRMKNLKIILTLGQIAHNSSIMALNKKLSEYKFEHLRKHQINERLILINCYHCSKYNINTKRLNFSDLDNLFKYIITSLNF